MNNLTPVDTFIRRNKRLYDIDNQYEDMTSLFEALNPEDYEEASYRETSRPTFKEKFERQAVRSQCYYKMEEDKVTVVYECACQDTYKVKHHFSYNQPHEVLLLCRKCHSREHARLNRLAVQTAFDISTASPSLPVERRLSDDRGANELDVCNTVEGLDRLTASVDGALRLSDDRPSHIQP